MDKRQLGPFIPQGHNLQRTVSRELAPIVLFVSLSVGFLSVNYKWLTVNHPKV